MGQAAALLIIIILTAVGDYMLKLASTLYQPLKTPQFAAGLLLYALTAVGWLYLMKHQSLVKIAVIYSSGTILILSAIGCILFREEITVKHGAGILLAVASVWLVSSAEHG